MPLRSLFTARRTGPAPIAGTPAVLDGPPLSIVVICYEMRHQLANTIRSLLPPYQSDVAIDQYEIRIIDNGSKLPLPEEFWNLSPNVIYEHVVKEQAPKNPGVAINRAVARTKSPVVCIMIDGARMVTPRVIRWGLDLATLSPATLVEVRGWHLGPQMQVHSIEEGYNSEREKILLEQIRWPDDGYKLFDISAPAASMPGGFTGLAAESTCLFMSRSLFDRTGGYDERYEEPGGGLCNADFFCRAVQASERVFALLGEGTFHQVHGGAATGISGAKSLRESFRRWKREYETLSRPWKSSPVQYNPILAGHLPEQCRKWLAMPAGKIGV
jgi:hypothetical protein